MQELSLAYFRTSCGVPLLSKLPCAVDPPPNHALWPLYWCKSFLAFRFGVVRAIAANSSNNNTSKKDDGWGDL